MAERGGFYKLPFLQLPASCSFFMENRMNKGDYRYFRPVRCVRPVRPVQLISAFYGQDGQELIG
jgi:hypothetical protein